MKLKKGIPLIDQHDKNGFWGGKFGGSYIPETLKKPIEDLTKEFQKLRKNRTKKSSSFSLAENVKHGWSNNKRLQHDYSTDQTRKKRRNRIKVLKKVSIKHIYLTKNITHSDQFYYLKTFFGAEEVNSC